MTDQNLIKYFWLFNLTVTLSIIKQPTENPHCHLIITIISRLFSQTNDYPNCSSFTTKLIYLIVTTITNLTDYLHGSLSIITFIFH